MARRGIDLALGAILAVLVLPLVLVLAIALSMVLRASPFFVQQRIGRDGRRFTFVKLRTLPPGTARYASKHELGELAGLPRLCRWVRARHLDELPQLLLVPLGTMSLVGPRPEMEVLHLAMDPVFATRRTQVKPGCTGLWQISARSTGLIAEAPDLDLRYLAERSLRLDLWVLWRTVVLFLRHRVADLTEAPAWVRGGRVGPLLATPILVSVEGEDPGRRARAGARARRAR